MSDIKVGWFCTYTPIEILDAAGVTPYGIRRDSGMGHEDIFLGDSMCSYVRSCLGGALAGAYDFLDAVVVTHSCECMRRLYDGWIFNQPDIKPQCLHLLDVPRVNNDRAIDYFAHSIDDFRKSVEKRYGRIDDATIAGAVEKRSEARRIMRELVEFKGGQVMAKSLTQPLEDLLAELRRIQPEVALSPSEPSGPRVLIYSGPGNQALVEAVEDAGGIVVYEHTCNGMRNIDEPDNEEGDIISRLARRYLGKSPCPRMLGAQAEMGLKALEGLVSKLRIDGIIYYSVKFCAGTQSMSPLFKETLGGRVPIKALEGDTSAEISTREIRSFVKKLAKRER